MYYRKAERENTESLIFPPQSQHVALVRQFPAKYFWYARRHLRNSSHEQQIACCTDTDARERPVPGGSGKKQTKKFCFNIRCL